MSALPATMTAIAIQEPGGPDVLEPEERPVPHPGEGEILIRVAAAGVNRPDMLQRQGHYPPPLGAPDIPGLEVAGEVVKLGPGAERWKVGDRVTALVAGGGYAEYCAAPAGSALPIPQGLSLEEAAALPETTFTVWHNVVERGRLRPGETILVHGGTSGIGTTAIQLAKAIGAEVIVTVGSEEKCEAAKGIGADHAINYRTRDFVKAVRDATGGRGADLILDMVGGDYIDRNFSAAAEDGRIVQIAFLHGAKAEADYRKLMVKRLTHTGSTLRARPNAFKANLARTVEETVWPWIAEGKYRPVMDETFPLEEAARAHARMEDGRHIGKIVLVTGA